MGDILPPQAPTSPNVRGSFRDHQKSDILQTLAMVRNSHLRQPARDVRETNEQKEEYEEVLSPARPVLAATTASAYAQFTFTSLDFLGRTKTTTRGINNHGSIVGSYRIDPPRHALVIQDGHFVPLAPTVRWAKISARPSRSTTRATIRSSS
jgi:hypothetical protein